MASKEPKTKHEEILFVVESTNDIVSENSGKLDEILNLIKFIFPKSYKDYKDGKKR